MDIKGKVHEISPVITVSEKFKKRELVIEYADQDKVNLFDTINVGDQVELFFNLRGRAWVDKMGKTSYFNTLVVWRINPITSGGSSPAPEFAAPADISPAPEDDDLPF
jgi:hypothetical protein